MMICLAETCSPPGSLGAFCLEIADFSVLFIIVIERLQPSNCSCRFNQNALLEHTQWKHVAGFRVTSSQGQSQSATRDLFPLMYHLFICFISVLFLEHPPTHLLLSISSSYSRTSLSFQPYLCNMEPYGTIATSLK